MERTNIIYEVLSTIKHNGAEIKKGSFVTESEMTGTETLVAEGILKEVVGATTKEEAATIVAQIAEEAAAAAEEVVPPVNTWGPRPDVEPQNDAGDDVVAGTDTNANTDADAPVETKYKVIQAFQIDNEESRYKGSYEVNDVVALDVAAATALIEAGVVAPTEEDNGDKL